MVYTTVFYRFKGGTVWCYYSETFGIIIVIWQTYKKSLDIQFLTIIQAQIKSVLKIAILRPYFFYR